jgi:hypothetical protein
MGDHTRSYWLMADSIQLVDRRRISQSILYCLLILLGESSGRISDVEGSLIMVRDPVSATHRSLPENDLRETNMRGRVKQYVQLVMSLFPTEKK